MRRFFLALGVRVEVVARPLPDVIQAAQRPADGVGRHALLGEELKHLAEQRHRPAGRRVAEVLGREGEQGVEQVLLVLVQQRVAAPAGFVGQRGGGAVREVSRDPVVDTLPGNAEHAGDVGGGAAEVELQDGERPAIEADVGGVRELTTEALPLPGGQVEPAHVLLLRHCRSGS
jgi:hypothetical protein